MKLEVAALLVMGRVKTRDLPIHPKIDKVQAIRL
jgi:hypothetical protein